MDLTLIVQLVVGLGGLAGFVSLLTVGAQKRRMVAESGKTDAEADAQFSEAYYRRAQTQIALLEPYERIQARMQEELDEQHDRIDELTAYIEILVALLREQGVTVPPMPRTRKAPNNG